MKSDDRWHTLISLFQTGQIGDEDFAELEQLLRTAPEARAQFHRACRVDSLLRREAENLPSPLPLPSISPFPLRSKWWITSLAAAAIVMLTMLTWTHFSRPRVIATLVSAENASWESSLPTAPGSPLTPGYLKLTSGIGTVRFASGAEVTLEAPAHLVLETPMRGKLLLGAATIDVPKPAIGFILETPHGYAVDHGTKFAVKVAADPEQSDFEVISGKISVFLPATGEEAHLTEQKAATISGEKLTTFEEPAPESDMEPGPDAIRISSSLATTVIRNNKAHKWTRTDMLLVNQSRSGNGFDRRAIFSFDLAGVDLKTITKANLRLNQVSSGVGYASRLPLINRFAVYGLTNPAKRDWRTDSTFEDAPAPGDGLLLGKFEIPRSRQSGSFGIDTPDLLQFAKNHVGEPITLILVRETTMLEGHAMVHAFASDSHAESSGPVLEFSKNHQ